jgi:outer membrane receptor protein involved in Fe transport
LPCILKNPGFVVANVGGSYDFANGVTWYARINNVLNQRYEEVLGFPAYRLNFVSGVRVNLGGERGLHLKR